VEPGFLAGRGFAPNLFFVIDVVEASLTCSSEIQDQTYMGIST
jgi:hypothetical protein